jgi:hypothetical protein
MPQHNDHETAPKVPGPDDKPRPGVRSTWPESPDKGPATPASSPVVRTFFPEPEDHQSGQR